ncbi:MAG TPA: hypothetical protein VFJ93_12675, partial [Gaiellaceae bacterium]|nr:hypothetical protein [Gaiellaceae bacterium]
MRYWWAGLGLLVLVAMYAVPVAAVFKQPTIAAVQTPLPALSLPDIGFPLLHVPALRHPAPLPALPKAPRIAQPRITPTAHATRTQAPTRVPVVSDSHAQFPRAKAQDTTAPKDPFANVAVVEDDIGAPIELPALPAQAVMDTAAPPAPADASESESVTTTQAEPATTTAAARTPAVVKQITAVIGADGAGTLPAAAARTAAPVRQLTASTGSSKTLQVFEAGEGGDSSLTASGTSDTSNDAGDTAGGAGGDQSLAGTAGGTSGGTSGGTGGTAGGDANAAGGSGDASTTVTDQTDATTKDPSSEPGSGPSPPAANVTTTSGGTVSSSDGSATVAFTPGAAPSDLAVSVTATSGAPAGISLVGAVYDLTAVDTATGSAVSTFAAAPVLTIHYDPNGPAPSSIFYLDPVNGPVAIASTVDTVNHTISAALPHFSAYAAGNVVDTTLTPTLTVVELSGGTSSTLNVTVVVTGTSTPQEAATVTFSTDFGQLSAPTCATNPSGQCSVTLTSSDPGIAHVQAAVLDAGSGGHPSDSKTVTFHGAWNIALAAGSDHTVDVTTGGGNITVTIDGTAHAAPISTVTALSITGADAQTNAFTVHSTVSSLTIPITLTGGGSGATNTLAATGDVSYALSGGQLQIGGKAITLASIGARSITAGAGDNTFAFSDGFGTATLTGGGGSDTLDLRGLTGITHATDLLFGDTGGDSLTLVAPAPDHIDFTLVSAASVVTKVDDLLGKVSDVVSAVDTAGNALSSVLPLLDPSVAGSVDKIVKLVDSFNAVKTKVHDALTGLPALDFSDVISALNGALSSGDIPFPLRGMHFDSAYDSLGGDFAAYITATLTAGNVASCSTGTGCLSTSVPLDFGDALDAIGISLDSDSSTPGTQPPVFTARGTIGVDLALGLNISSPGEPFLRSDGHIDIAFQAKITTLTATVSLGLLEASIASGSITIGGTASLALHDTGAADGIDPLSELGADAVDVTAAGTVSSPITLTASIKAGVEIGGSDLSIATAQLKICFGADCSPNPSVPLFDSNGATPEVNVTFHTNADGGHDLLNSLTNATSFSNAGPNEILAMLGQIASFFNSMASQSFLGSQQIPFTSITLGQALDYAKEFTHSVIDPLFKSGDSTHPDANGDGRVDVNDFNFASVQGLLDRLEAALGLPTGFLHADYDPTAGTLEFNFSLDKTLGIGTSVDVAPSGALMIDLARTGGPKFTVGPGSVSGTYKITYTGNGNSTGDLAWNASLTQVRTAVGAITGIPSGVTIDCLNSSASCTGGPFIYSFDSDGTTGKLVPNETQFLLVGASSGTFVLSTATSSVTVDLATSPNKGDIQSKLTTLLGGAFTEVRCADGSASCVGGPYEIVFDLGSTAGTDVPLIAVDSTGLANAHNLKQILLVPAGTGDFWLSYANGTTIQITEKISAGITAGGLASKLAALSNISVSGPIKKVDGDTAAYLITLGGSSDVKTIGAAGGFSIDFGASLGGLAGVQTTGSIIPLARLVANFTFGVNLTPSSAIAVGPAQFTAGPRVDIQTTHDGGKTSALRVIRPGVLGAAGTVLVLTVNGGGTFTLTHASTTSSGLAPGVDATSLESAIATILGISATNVHVRKSVRPEGWVYTITFDDSVNPALAQAITVNGAGLTARDEEQKVDVVNATGGSFVLTFNGQGTAPIAYNAPATGTDSVQDRLRALSSIGSTGVSVSGTPGHYTITFGGGSLHNTNTGDLSPDASLLTGALASGNLAASANFTVSITNGSAVITSIAQDAIATVTQSTIADGGTGLGVTTTTPGSASANEVQTLTVRASAGTFTISVPGGSTTGPLAFDIGADALKTALGPLVGGTANLTVSKTSSTAGSLYSITYVAGKGLQDVPQLVANGTLTAQNETQKVTVAGAGSGSYTLFFDKNNSGGAPDSGEETASILTSDAAAAVESKLNAMLGAGAVHVTGGAGVYTIVFDGAPYAGTNVRPLTVRNAALTAQDEIQTVSLLYATGGTFTLTLNGHTTAPLAYDISDTDLANAINLQLLAGGPYTATAALASGVYTITFSGGSGANKHLDKLVGDAGGLENATSTSVYTVSGFTSSSDLVNALQAALDAAAVAGGITPGFLNITVTSGGVTAGQPVFGATNLGGVTPNDQAFEIGITLTITSGTFSTGTTTNGKFTLSYNDGATTQTTPQLAIGSGASVLKSAIEALSNFHGTATVSQNGSGYTVAFAGGPSLSGLSARLELSGNVARASAGSRADFASALDAAVDATLKKSGFTSAANPATITLSGTSLHLVSSVGTFQLVFASPVVAESGGGRISLTAPQVQYTFDADKTPVTLQRHVDVGLSWNDPAFQVLGLGTSPVRLDYTGHPMGEIQFTLIVNDAEIPVIMPASSSVTSIDGLVSAIQSAIDAAIQDAFDGNALSHDGGATVDSYKILVCRPNINPAGEKCDHVGNRIEFQVVTDDAAHPTKITTLAMNVPAFLDDGTTRNGAVTELGFEAVAGATHRGRAGTFYLYDVNLTGSLRVALQDVSATASIGFLALKATAAGTVTSDHWLVSADITIALRNPLSNDPEDQKRIDLAVLAAALRNGHFLWDSAAAGGTADSPGTGFFLGTLSGGFGVDLSMKPDGFLQGLAGDTMDAHLHISMESTDWFTSIPSPDIHWDGPDFDQVLQRFRNLDSASIAQALQLIVNFVRELAHPTEANPISNVLNAQLPLINKSLAQLLDIASDIADQIHEAITNPTGAIQMLNNVLANAFGKPTPSVAVSETQHGSPSLPEVVHVLVDAIGGTFRLTFPPNRGPPVTTDSIAFDASTSAVQAALIKLTGVDVTVTGSPGDYTITFNTNGAQPLFLSDATKLVKTSILSYDAGTGQITFEFDLGASTQIARPFNLDLTDVLGTLPDPLNSIVSSMIGAGGNGNLTINLGANLHIALGLDLSQPATLAAGSLHVNATGGTFTITYDGHTTSALAWNIADADLQAKLRELAGLETVTVGGGPGTWTITGGDASKFSVDGAQLTGTQKSFYLKTGDGDHDTHLDLTASAAGTNLNFNARLGPFGLFVKDGSASLGGTIRLHFLDGPRSDGRFNLIGYGDGAVSSDLGAIGDYIGADSVCVDPDHGCVDTFTIAQANLPLFVGTESFQIPINDPLLENPTAFSNRVIVSVGINFEALLNGGDDVFQFTFGDGNPSNPSEMPWAGFSPQMPSLFALLADPSVIVDGLDSVLAEVQNLLQGQIFGVKLPLLGDLLSDNPVSNLVQSIREQLLQPLANLLRENNVGFDGLKDLIQTELFSVFGPDGLDILKPYDGADRDVTAADIRIVLMRNDGDTARTHPSDGTDSPTNLFNANQIEFDMKLGYSISYTAPTIALDLGIPALGLDASFTPQVTLTFGLNFGFGVDDRNGFYFVTDGGTPGSTADDKELTVGALVTLSSADCPDGSVDQAQVNGRLLFLALHIKDGVDLDGNGAVKVVCDGDAPTTDFELKDMEISSIFFSGGVDVKTPDETASKRGELTLSDLLGGDLGSIFDLSIRGGADLRADAVVDFSTLGADLANILPSISTKILIDFGLSWSSSDGFHVSSPQVVFADISLDLGSFISDFAGPILQKIKDILDPLAWLIGPDGFLNKRIPLLSDLAGHTITGADLVTFFDPTDGPKVKAFLDFVLEIYHLIDLVQDAAADGHVELNFGDLVLAAGDHTAGSILPSVGDWSFFDSPLDFGFGGDQNIGDMPSLGNLKVPSSLPAPSMQGAQGSKSSEFTKGVTGSTSIEFPILQNPSSLINLLFGKPVTLVEIQLPELGFQFNYRQIFPIIGPLVGTFEGGIGAKLDLRFGYDTQGLTDFVNSGNPAALLQGFFFDPHDAQGNPLPVAQLHAEIAVGAAISLALITAGVEGGISADIFFNWNDLNKDGKVRFDELGANLIANGFNPLSVFDITGQMELFLRAYVEINLFITKITLTFEFLRLKLFSFESDFVRPSFLGTMSGGTLTLAVGPSSKNRIQGDLGDIAEKIFVSGSGSGVDVWSDQFGRSSSNKQHFDNVTAIVGNFGAGDDYIDLSGLDATGITVTIHGGDGNDTLIGPKNSACSSDTHFCASLFGDGGNDTLRSSSDQNDLLDGGGGDDTLYGSNSATGNSGASTLRGGSGADSIHGGTGAETIDSGRDDDTIDSGGGADQILGVNAGSVVHVTTSGPGTATLDLSGRTEALHITLKDDKILVGWGALSGATGAFIAGEVDYVHEIRVDDVSAFTTILGGKGADIFTIYKTASAVMTLDGKGGNDTYDFKNVGGGSAAQIHADVNDRGNPWDSGDQIVIDGSSSGDTIVSTDSQVTGTAGQTITYHRPDPDKNVLSLNINGNDGVDHITVQSTRDVVPVKVDGGAGNDVINVGGGTLDDIVGLSRPGIQVPYGVGPLVIVGGIGLDTLVVDNSSDSAVRSGTLTSWVEQRQTAPDGTEVGGLGGLGMKMYADFDRATLGLTGLGDGRIEFEDVEALTVLLGSGDTTFTVGGDPLRPQLPKARQEKVFYFDQSPAVMASIVGGTGNDTFQVVSTVQLDRTQLDNSGGLVAVTTKTQGVGTTTAEVQHLNIRDGKDDGVNTFTLSYGGASTGALHFNITKEDLQAALRLLPGLGAVTVGGGSGVFDVTFPGLGNVDQLVATFTGKLVKVTTDQTGNHSTATPEKQTVHLSGITDGNGYFTVKYQFMETRAMPLDVDAATFDAAIKAAFTFAGGNISTAAVAGGFQITFGEILGNVDQVVAQVVPLLFDGGAGTGSDRFRVSSIYEDTFFYGGGGTDSANVNLNAITLAPFIPSDVVGHVTISAPTYVGGDMIQRVDVTNVTGGTFRLGFKGEFTTPLAWDAPGQGECISVKTQSTPWCSVQQALENLSTIGDQNVEVTKSDIDGSYSITFVKALGGALQPLLTSDVVITQTQAGDGAHDAQQHVVIDGGAQGAFSLDYTYEVAPLGLTTDPNAVGTLSAGTYYYRVSAITGAGETLASAEVHTTIGNNGAVKLAWGDVANATGYRIYRGTTAGGESIYFESVLPSFFDDGLGAQHAGTPPTSSVVTAIQTTIPIDVDAAPSVVQAALEILPSIGAGNVLVTGSGRDYTITFTNALGHRAIPLLGGATSTLRSNGINAIVTMDGGGGGDTYNVNLIGGRTSSLINVFDSGAAGDGGDALTVNGTDFPDVFLLRAATADGGLAFVALINGPTPLTPAETDPYERINYNQQLESIVVNGGSGDDQFYVDDTRASITVNGDEGNDFFQIGQLYRSRRTPALAGVAPEDVFATIETTLGWLSNGISKPMTINGGVGNDNFIVFHNLDTLSLFGDAGNDSFLVQAFALAGSQEDHRALTDLSGGGGADLIKYAVNAPVNIDGGDGFDTVVVIGTEFNDDFVVTSTGVFGAGLHVSFVNIESLTVDGGAGDDRFFVQSTGPTFTTEIDGGLGSDFISVEGPTPVNGVISNDLLGHSGIVTHSVESSDGSYAGINVVGVSANVADDDTYGIVVTESNGGSMVVQAGDPVTGPFNLADHTADDFTVVLTRPPGTNVQVVVNIQPPSGIVMLVGGVPQRDTSDEVQVVTLTQVSSGTFTLTLNGQTTAPIHWDASANDVRAALEALSNVDPGDVAVTQTGTTYTISFQGGHLDENVPEMSAALTGGGIGTIKVTTSVDGGFSVARAQQLVFDASNWWIPQKVTFALDSLAKTVGTNSYFQNSATVRCSNEFPPSDPPVVPNCVKTITGSVLSGTSIDMNSHTVGDEYATITSSSASFADYRPVTSSLPEGLRGTQLKISGNDPEAEGQVRLVLGSYLTHIQLGGATSGTFSITFGSYGTTVDLAFDAAASAVKAALETLLGDNMVDVTAVTGGYDVALRGTLYLSNAAHLVVNAGTLNGSGPTADIDGSTLKLNEPWSVQPKVGAAFEVSLFGGVKVPAVRVALFPQSINLVVVAEQDGSTNVSQGDLTVSSNVDTIQVRLSSQPDGPVTVHLGDHNAGLITYSLSATGSSIDSLVFDEDTWDDFVTVYVRAVDDQVVRGFHRADLSATAAHYFSYLATVLIGDNHWAGVRVVESGGSTNVIEQFPGLSSSASGYQADAFAGSPLLPAYDSYTVSLTKAPTATVTIRATAQPTRTSQTGGIVSFAQQVDVSFDGVTWGSFVLLTFDGTDWNAPKTVYVRAHDDSRVDGQDTQVFAPQLAQLNAIQGPLFVNGGEGANRAGLLEREPVMLPGERNETPSMGQVVSSTPGTTNGAVAATVTIEHASLGTIGLSVDAGTSNTVQTISVNAISGTFKLTYNGVSTDALAFDAPAVTVQDALRALLQLVDPGADLTVARNGSELQVTFFNTGTGVLAIGEDHAYNSTHLGPQTPAQLTGITFLVTSGPAKNKTRIITGGVQNADGSWTLTLDKAWFSPFTNDSSTPSSLSTYTLLTTNPNLLVDESSQANLLYMYDNDNPASYNDEHYTRGGDNPFGAVEIKYDTSLFGPADEDGTVHPLDQFRVIGLGMGGTRCIGGPEDPVSGGCTGPVGANQPGGITFRTITDLELNLGDGANHVVVDTFTNVPAGTRAPKTTINTRGGNDVVDLKGITGHTFVNLGGGSDTINVSNAAQRLTDLAALLTVSGDSPQANVINYANGSPAQGTAVDPVDAIQILSVDASGGSYAITYSPRPLNLTAAQNRKLAPVGTGLAAGSYYYVVTALTALGETLPSPEAYATVTADGRVDLAWYAMPGATGYKIYRGTTPSGENVLIGTVGAGVTTFLDTGAAGTPAALPTVGVVQSTTVNAADGAGTIQSKLQSLSLIGPGNVLVEKAGGTYRIHFVNGAGGTAIALLGTDPTALQSGAGVVDHLNIVDTARTDDSSALLTSTSLTGLSLPAANEIQQLVVDATTGSYTLTYFFPVTPTALGAVQATGGTLTAGTHFYRVTAFTDAGESLASNLASAVTADGGAVDLSWTGIAGAHHYRIYRGTSEAMDDGVVYVDTPDASLVYTDIGGGTSGMLPTTSDVVDQATTGSLAWNADASVVQAALEALVGSGNVVVSKNDDVYTIRFQGTLSDSPVRQLLATPLSSLQKLVEQPGGGASTTAGTAAVHTRADISDTPTQVNQVQILTVTATGGSYRLTFHVNGVTFHTDPIPYNAGAEQLRQIIQNAIAAGETDDPFLRAYLVDKLDVTVDRYPSGYLAQNIYVLHFQGELRRESFGPGLDTVTIESSLTGGTAWLTTRMDGIQYYGIEDVQIATGSGTETFNVQGTTKGSNGYTGTAVTTVALNAGDEHVYLSSNADLDDAQAVGYWRNFDFLTGNLDDFRGALNLNLGDGRHRLFMSDEGSSHPDDYAITDSIGDAWNKSTAGLLPGYDIYVTRAGLPGIAYTTSSSGNLFDGIVYWTGSGADIVHIDGTQTRAGERTPTVLNTGLGNDTVTASLADGGDAFFVADLSGGPATGDPKAHTGGADTDSFDGSASGLQLVVIGGFANDTIRGGSNRDVILG